MGDPNVIEQAEWVTPAINGEMLCITVDATSREYDLFTIALGVDGNKKPEAKFYLNLKADGANIYYTTSAASSKTVDNTAAVVAGGAVAYTANAADVVFASTTEAIYIDRSVSRYIQMKTASGTAIARIRLSSCLRAGDT